MTGIAQMFAELSGDEPDWFQMAFDLERIHEWRTERRKDKRADPRWVARRREYQRRYESERRREYNRQRKRAKYQTDSAHAEKKRAYQREYWRRKQAERMAA